MVDVQKVKCITSQFVKDVFLKTRNELYDNQLWIKIKEGINIFVNENIPSNIKEEVNIANTHINKQ